MSDKPTKKEAATALGWLCLAVAVVIIVGRLAWSVGTLLVEACHR